MRSDSPTTPGLQSDTERLKGNLLSQTHPTAYEGFTKEAEMVQRRKMQKIINLRLGMDRKSLAIFFHIMETINFQVTFPFRILD